MEAQQNQRPKNKISTSDGRGLRRLINVDHFKAGNLCLRSKEVQAKAPLAPIESRFIRSQLQLPVNDPTRNFRSLRDASMTKLAMMMLKRGGWCCRTPFTTSYPVTRIASSLLSSFSFSTKAPAPAGAHFTNEGFLFADSPPSPKVAAPSLLQPGVVIYDGVCHLCHTGVKCLIKVDKHRKIKFCCLQSNAAEPYLRLCGLDREDVLRRFVFIEGPGLYHQASTAALKIASYLPFPYSTLSALLIIPTPLRDAIYDYIAKRRYDWFGKEEDCIVLQEQEMLERFIDREEMIYRIKKQ